MLISVLVMLNKWVMLRRRYHEYSIVINIGIHSLN